MILAISILVSSILLFVGFLNYNFRNSTKKPSCNSTKDNTKSCMNKDDDHLKRVFDTFDKDGDGFITREELKESLNNIGMFMPLKEVEEIMDSMDCNKDGLVDVDEFKKLYELIKGRNEGDVEGDLKEAFDVFDEDKDGLITVKELGLVLSSLGLKQGKLEDDCKEMIKKVDVDGDGMVNFDEFKIMMTSNFASSTLVSASYL